MNVLPLLKIQNNCPLTRIEVELKYKTRKQICMRSGNTVTTESSSKLVMAAIFWLGGLAMIRL